MATDPRDEPTQPYEPEPPANGLPPKLPPVSRKVNLNTDSFLLPLPAPERVRLATRASVRAGDSGPAVNTKGVKYPHGPQNGSRPRLAPSRAHRYARANE
ncbi:MAG: hypothetical protein HZB20_12755 [Chloroflexi bacterium]|nr:hypothetical protein [Chloroflexota bacterium]